MHSLINYGTFQCMNDAFESIAHANDRFLCFLTDRSLRKRKHQPRNQWSRNVLKEALNIDSRKTIPPSVPFVSVSLLNCTHTPLFLTQRCDVHKRMNRHLQNIRLFNTVQLEKLMEVASYLSKATKFGSPPEMPIIRIKSLSVLGILYTRY